MKYKNVIKISAEGTRGKVNGLECVAEPTPDGKYVLNKKVETTEKSKAEKNKTNKARNKVFANTLTEAANMLATNEYVINLIYTIPVGDKALGKFKRQRSLQNYESVTIIEAS